MSVAGVPQRRLHGEGPSDRETTSVFGHKQTSSLDKVRSFKRQQLLQSRRMGLPIVQANATQRRNQRGVAVVRRRAWAMVAKEFGAAVSKRGRFWPARLIDLTVRYRGRYRATYRRYGVFGSRRHMHSDHRRQQCGALFRGLYVQVFLMGRGPASTLSMAGIQRKLSHVGRRSVGHEKRCHVDDAPHGRRRC